MRELVSELFDRWVALWNGDLTQADKIMAPEFTLHYAQPNGAACDDVHHPRALAELIAKYRAGRPGLRYERQGELVLESHGDSSGLAAHPYGARQPGPAGESAISGIDILRFVNGKITEVWSVSGGRAGRSFYPDITSE